RGHHQRPAPAGHRCRQHRFPLPGGLVRALPGRGQPAALKSQTKTKRPAGKPPPALFFYDLSRDLASTAAKHPKNTAAVVPAAPAVRPPVKAPKRPRSATAARTPSVRAQPKPHRGTVAPAPAKSARGP